MRGAPPRHTIHSRPYSSPAQVHTTAQERQGQWCDCQQPALHGSFHSTLSTAHWPVLLTPKSQAVRLPTHACLCSSNMMAFLLPWFLLQWLPQPVCWQGGMCQDMGTSSTLCQRLWLVRQVKHEAATARRPHCLVLVGGSLSHSICVCHLFCS